MKPSTPTVEEMAKQVAESFKSQPEFEWLTKVVYLKHITDAIKEDPNLWATFDHDKQVEIHQIRMAVDAHFKAMKKIEDES